MLHEFITKHRGAILARTRERIAARPAPRATAEELERGIPLFLEQLVATLRAPSDPETVEAVATRHGADLLRQGFTVAQVVHDYGGVCQATTELADELRAPIAVDEFRTFNRCLNVVRRLYHFGRSVSDLARACRLMGEGAYDRLHAARQLHEVRERDLQ